MGGSQQRVFKKRGGWSRLTNQAMCGEEPHKAADGHALESEQKKREHASFKFSKVFPSIGRGKISASREGTHGNMRGGRKRGTVNVWGTTHWAQGGSSG